MATLWSGSAVFWVIKDEKIIRGRKDFGSDDAGTRSCGYASDDTPEACQGKDDNFRERIHILTLQYQNHFIPASRLFDTENGTLVRNINLF